MATSLICVHSESGVPLFTRNTSTNTNLQYSETASLIGIHSFGKINSIKLLSMRSKTSRIVCKEYAKKILLFVITISNETEETLVKLLNNVFASIQLFLGVEFITSVKNQEILKKELKKTYELIDAIIERRSHPRENTISDLTFLPEVKCIAEDQVTLPIQSDFDNLMKQVDTKFGLIMISNEIYTSTPDWWTLHSSETFLLSKLAYSISLDTKEYELSIYLPFSNPMTPTWLFIVKCGEFARLIFLISSDYDFNVTGLSEKLNKFKASLTNFSNTLEKTPYWSSYLNLSKSIHGLIFQSNLKAGMILEERAEEKRKIKNLSISTPSHFEYLRMYYKNTYNLCRDIKDKHEKIVEVYWSSKLYRCYLIKGTSLNLYVLYDANQTTLFVRFLSKRIYQEMLSKNI